MVQSCFEDDGAAGVILIGIQPTLKNTMTCAEWPCIMQDLQTAFEEEKAPFYDKGEQKLNFSRINFKRISIEDLGDELEDATAKVWTCSSPTDWSSQYNCLHTIRKHRLDVTDLSIHPLGDYLLTAVIVWDVKNDQATVATLLGHESAVQTLSFSGNGYYLASGSRDGPVNLQTIQVEGGCTSVCFDATGQYLAVSGSTVQVFNFEAKTSLTETIAFKDGPEHTDAVTGLCWGPNAKTLASVSMDKSLKLYSAKIVDLESITPPLSGCTCGSGQQLEEEHERILAQSRNLSTRADAAAAREEQLGQRLEGLDLELERLDSAEEELRWTLVRTKRGDDLARTAEELSDLERKVLAKESELAQDESDLIEARNLVEGEIRRVQEQHDVVEQEALSLQSEYDDLGYLLDEVEREQWSLESDRSLLAEIESQVEPIRRRLVERERRLRSEEEELNAAEERSGVEPEGWKMVELEDREAQLEPEYQESTKAAFAVQRRQQELERQIEETRQQQQRLLHQLQEMSVGQNGYTADLASEEEKNDETR
eukprot:g11760.t1